MKDLIQQAAEDYRKDAKYFDGIGTREQLNKVKDTVYRTQVNHFLSYAKENGYELLRVDGDAKAIYAETWKDADSHELIENINIKACANALALGAAKERERMKGVFEKAGIEGWRFRDGMWENYISPMFTMFKTTDELINHYENKEG